MCYVLYVASALTLSEVRSMLPAGMSAHALAPDDDRRLRRAFRPARTVVQLLIGPAAATSCCIAIPSPTPRSARSGPATPPCRIVMM